jgi:hypothetical protein
MFSKLSSATYIHALYFITGTVSDQKDNILHNDYFAKYHIGCYNFLTALGL